MDLTRIPVGPAPPEDIYVVVEIPRGGEPVKYEIDKVSGAVFVDRFLHTAMFYPGNYGFVPHTLAEDGDPLDVLIVGRSRSYPAPSSAAARSAPSLMEDEAGPDEKIIVVPVDALHPVLYRRSLAPGFARDLARPDRPFLHPLQGFGTAQVGQLQRVGRRGGGASPGTGRDRAGESMIGAGRTGASPIRCARLSRPWLAST